MATVDDAIRDAYKARDERIQAIRDRAYDLADTAPLRQVQEVADLIAKLANEVR